jgi:hypothetical protein
MALTFPKRSFTGAGVAGTLDAPGITSIYTAGDTFKSSTTLTGWDDVTGGVWAGSVVVAFGVGTAGEEKILCNFTQSTSTFTIVSRGYDGTSSAATSTWSTGSLFTIVFTATEAAELNAVTQSMKTILTSAGTTTTPQPITVGSSAGSIGTGTKPSAIDHDHKITASTLNGWLTASASGQLPAAVQVYLSSLNSGALPTAVTASAQWSNSRTTDLALTVYGTWTTTGTPTVTVTGYNRYLVIGNAVMTNGSGASHNQYARISTVSSGVYTIIPGTIEYANAQVPTASPSAASITGSYSPASASTSVTFALQATQGSSATSSFLSTGSTITVIGFN